MMIATTTSSRQPHSNWLARLRTIAVGLGGRGVVNLGLARASTSTSANGLLNCMIGYWPGDESSGDMLDLHSGKTLTQSNSPGSTTGKVYSTARTFNGSNQQFSRASETDLQGGDVDFTVAAWCYVVSTGLKWIVSKWGSNQYDYAIVSAGSGYFRFFTRNAANTVSYQPSAISFGLVPLNTWCLVIGWHDAVANTANIQVNDVMGESLSVDEGGTMAGSADFRIGVSSFLSGWWNGRIGPVMFWRSAPGGGGALSSAKRAALYNGGVGLAYAAFTN